MQAAAHPPEHDDDDVRPDHLARLMGASAHELLDGHAQVLADHSARLSALEAQGNTDDIGDGGTTGSDS